MMKKFIIIKEEIRSKRLPQGYEIQESDVGKSLDLYWGKVLPIDIGKKVWVRSYGLVMENDEQRKERKNEAGN